MVSFQSLTRALAVEAHQRVVADAGQEGVQPGVALAQLALAPHLLADVGQHRHQARAVELQQGQRQHLRLAHALARRAAFRWMCRPSQTMPLGARTAAHRWRSSGATLFQRGEQVGQAAVARQRHQELGRDRVDHHDLAVDAGLHQADRGQVQELDQGFVLGGAGCRAVASVLQLALHQHVAHGAARRGQQAQLDFHGRMRRVST
jgi:hypothetical protein